MQKRKLIDIVNANPIIQELANKRSNNFKLLYSLAKISKNLNESTEFYVQSERKLVETYAKKDKNGNVMFQPGTNNIILFENNENRIAFNDEIVKLQLTEVDVPDEIEICESDFKRGEISFSANQIMRMDGFIKFIFDDHLNEECKKEGGTNKDA